MPKPVPDSWNFAHRFNLKGLPRKLSEIIMQPKDVTEVNASPKMLEMQALAAQANQAQAMGLKVSLKQQVDVLKLLEEVHRETLHEIVVKGQIFTKDGVDTTDQIRQNVEQQLVEIEGLLSSLEPALKREQEATSDKN